MNGRILRRSVLAALAAVALVGLSATAEAQTKVTIGLSSGVNQLPSLVAVEKGFFKEEGLDVEIRPVARSAIAVEALTAGSIEFAESAHIPFMAVTGRGAPLVSTAVAARGFYGKLVASNRHKDLKTLEDFKGKRVGTQVGTGMHTVLVMILEQMGMTEQDLGITNLRVVDMPAAMASDSFDAVIGWEPMMQRIIQGGYGVEVVSVRDFEKMGGVTFPFLLATRQDYRDENPEIVQAVVNGYAKAHRFIRENPDEAVDIFTAMLEKTGSPLGKDTAKAMLFDTDRFGTPAFTDADWKDLNAMAEFAHKQGQLDPKPDFGKIIDDSFGKKAEESLTN